MSDRFDLTAGPLTMQFSDGDLRNIRCGGAEIVNRIYFALRDENWGTVAGEISKLSVERRNGGFLVRYRSEHRSGDIHFVWMAEIRGEKSGRLSFSVDGEALSSFRRNRIGLCVLHPASAAGDRVTISHPDGGRSDGAFPRLVSPHQPFKEIASIHHFLPAGLEARTTFSGEVFETEDQRNWTDGSYKTYGTPLSLPFPVGVAKGDRIVQSVEIELGGKLPQAGPQRGGAQMDAGATRSVEHEAVRITVGRDAGRPAHRLPALGVSYGQEPGGLSPHALERLAEIKPTFLSLELLLGDDRWRALLAAAMRDSLGSGIPLSIALRLGSRADAELDAIGDALRKGQAKVSSWTILSEESPTTRSEHLELARERLAGFAGGSPIGGGTRAFFAELNRNHPAFELLDFVTYTVNPQVHAFDDVSIVETLEGQRATVRSAAELSGGKAVRIGAVTLKPQWNPNATAPPAPPAPGELPGEVDPRQRGAFAAAWTLGSIKSMAESGIEAASYYEVEGWKGLMERPEGSPLPERFPSRPKELFPLYSVFRALATDAGATLVPSGSTAPLQVDALALRSGARSRVFLMNYGDSARRAIVDGVREVGEVSRIVPAPPEGVRAPETERSGAGVNVVLEAHTVYAFDCAT